MGWSERWSRAPAPLRLVWRVLERSLGAGSVHAGNLAYLALTSLFQFVLLLVAVAAMLGRTDAGAAVIATFLAALPGEVSAVLAEPIAGLIAAPAGGLLVLGVLVGLWSASGFVETVRAIVLHAYGARGTSPWRSRLLSVAGVLAVALLLLAAFTLQFVAVGAREFVMRAMPEAAHAGVVMVDRGRLIPAVVMFLALWLLFALLTPAVWRTRAWRWPGAALTASVWLGATTLLPQIIASAANYHLTYGSLAGVMATLLFFYVIGMGLVAGANLNAALAGAERLPASMGKQDA